MSGKLIMKRKLDKTHQSSRNVEVAEEVPSVSSMDNNLYQRHNGRNDNDDDDDESSSVQPDNKRLRCDTPPSEADDLNSHPLPQANERNRHLLEAIQLKMLELQNELDAFEHDVEAHEDDYYYDQANQQQQPQMSEQDAEALGFAMCAQETMLFLQREGVPSESLLYTRLRDALVGRSQPDRVFHL